jgi:hypothetical protein
LSAGLVACSLLLMLLSRRFGFFMDEWEFIVTRRAWTLGAFLRPHNGHISIVPVTIYKILFLIVGLRHSWPYELVLVALHATCVVSIYWLARRRVNGWLALAPAGLFLLPGAAYEDLLWAFQIGFLGSVAAGLGALLCLDRNSQCADRLAGLLLGVSLSSSSIGLPFAVGVFVLLLLERENGRRLLVAAIPLCLYALWYVGYGSSESQVVWSNVTRVPGYDAEAGGYAMAAFANLALAYGSILLLAVVVALGVQVSRGHRLPSLAIVGITGTIVFWTLAAMTRGQLDDPGSPRYVYPSMALLLVLGIAYLDRVPKLARRSALVLVGTVVYAILSGVQPLIVWADHRDRIDSTGDNGLLALALSHPRDPTVLAIRSLHSPIYAKAHEIVQEARLGPRIISGQDASLAPAIRKRLGTPAQVAHRIRSYPLNIQLDADRSLLALEPPALSRPTIVDLQQASPIVARRRRDITLSAVALHPSHHCTLLDAQQAGAVVTTRVAPGDSLYVDLSRGQLSIKVRRLARSVSGSYAEVLEARTTPVLITFARDESSLPWGVRLMPTASATICAVV